MSVRRRLPHVLAALLGVGAALLAACGAGTTGGIPEANAGDLKSQIVDVRQAVDDGRCADVPGQLRQVDEGIDDLPPSTDEQLVTNLRDGADTLRRLAAEECTSSEPTETQTIETQTQTVEEEEPTQTETQTQTVEEEEPTQTETTPPPTTDQPPPPPEPQPVPPPPVGTPGGGTEPDVP